MLNFFSNAANMLFLSLWCTHWLFYANSVRNKCSCTQLYNFRCNIFWLIVITDRIAMSSSSWTHTHSDQSQSVTESQNCERVF